MFNVVEIEVNSRCNRRCSYCPVSVLPKADDPTVMSEEIFGIIMSELQNIGYSGRLSYHFYNEPLLRKDLNLLVAVASRDLPDAKQVLYTNGDFLSEKVYRSLLDAGIEEFVVTRHDFTPIPERPKQIVQYPTDLAIDNRGGSMGGLDSALSVPCYVPQEVVVISVIGDVIFCFEDAKRSHVMGNVTQKNIMEIWNSKRYHELRRKLEIGDRRGASHVCEKCDNTAYQERGRTW